MMLKPIMRLPASIFFMLLWMIPLLSHAVPNEDEDKLIEIHSDAAEFDDKKATAYYYDNVTLEQGSRHLASDTLLIKRDANGKIDSMIATGKPAVFKAKPEVDKPFSEGHAETIYFYPKQDKIILINNAELTQNGDTIRGEHLTYFLSSHVLVSNPVPNKRTTVILPPKTEAAPQIIGGPKIE